MTSVRTAPTRPATQRRRSVRPRRTIGPAPSHPDLGRLAAAVARTWLEIEAHRRPFDQLAPLLSPAVAERLRRRLPRTPATAAPAPEAVRALRPSWTDEHACDVAVIVQRQGRSGALAIRIERHHGAWRVVELAAPEWGYRATPTSSRPAALRPADAFDDVLAGE